jgi:ATP-dependent DNA helicase RecQ
VGDLSDSEAGLLLALKDLRRRLAAERGVPAYIVFADRALEDMARKQPRSEADFATVHGVGAAKLRDFARPFLSCIAEHLVVTA